MSTDELASLKLTPLVFENDDEDEADLDVSADSAFNEAATPLPSPELSAKLSTIVPYTLTGQRLDKVVAGLFSDYSRSRLQDWIEKGLLLLDGKPATRKLQVRGGEKITLTPEPDLSDSAFSPEDLDLQVLADDEGVIVINKAAGMVVHPAVGNWQGTLLNGLLHHYPELALIPRAGIVHRLDKDTSGVMVVARSLIAQTDLVRQLQARTVKREYRALVWGELKQGGTVDVAIGRHPQDRLRMAVLSSGKPAITHYQPLAQGMLAGQAVTWVRCELETGRTHQIRVHMQHLGFPLVGDPLYGRKYNAAQLSAMMESAGVGGFTRQALHALHLRFIHPVDNQSHHYTAPLPDDLQHLLDATQIAYVE